MITILKGKEITVEWKVVSLDTKQPVDFEGVNAKVFLLAPDNIYTLPFDVVRDDFRGLRMTIPTGYISTGVYDLKVIWLKDALKDKPVYRNVSVKREVFALTDEVSEVTYDGDTIKIATGVESCGRDGLSAYEIAVFRGFAEGMSEKEWVESLDVVLASEESRVKAEEERVKAEDERADAEEYRIRIFTNNEQDRRQSFEISQSSRTDAFNYSEAQRQSIFESKEAQRDNNENSRMVKEEQRKIAETSRKSSEQGRETAESGRVSAESTRVADENIRKANEQGRVDAEKNRVNAETSRANAEVARVNTENTRKSNEQARVSAENGRVSAEAAREAAEGVREATFQANETSRQDAEVIREENERRRQEAETIREATYKNKVDRDDNAPKLTAGFANNLVGRGEATSEEIGFRPSGGDTSIEDGTARIERLKGNTVVWNQLRPEVERTSNSIKIVSTSPLTLESVSAAAVSLAYFVQMANVIKDHIYLIRYTYLYEGTKDRVRIHLSGIDDASFNFTTSNFVSKNTKETRQYILRSAASASGLGLMIGYNDGMEVGERMTIYEYQLIDLTQMFGAGNEPTTIEEFHARKPLGVSDTYNEGELVSTTADEIKSVGFNALNVDRKERSLDKNYAPTDKKPFKEGEFWNGMAYNGYHLTSNYRLTDVQITKNTISAITSSNTSYGLGYPIKVVPNKEYYCSCSKTSGSATVHIGYFDKDGVYLQSSNVHVVNTKFTIPSNAYWALVVICSDSANTKFTVENLCINLVHTGYRNGEYEPYKEFRRNIPIKDIKDKDGNQLFPNGLLSAGSVYDEITATKAIKRIGVVDMGTLNWQSYETPIYRIKSKEVDRINMARNPNVSAPSNMLCAMYQPAPTYNLSDTDKGMRGPYSTTIYEGDFHIKNTSYTDAATFKAAMSGVMLYYELAEPIEVDLPEPLNLDYEVSDFGTEEVISDVPTTPMKADIIYQFNAVDRIRDNSRHTAEAAGLLNAKADKTAVEAAINELTNAIPEVVNDLITGGADKALSAEMGKELDSELKPFKEGGWLDFLYKPKDYWNAKKDEGKIFIVLDGVKSGDIIYYLINKEGQRGVYFALYDTVKSSVSATLDYVEQLKGTYNVGEGIDGDRTKLCLLKNNSESEQLSIVYSLEKLIQREELIKDINDSKGKIEAAGKRIEQLEVTTISISEEIDGASKVDEDVTAKSNMSIRKAYDINLVEVAGAADVYVTYNIDVSDYVGCNVSFKTYSSDTSAIGYNGIILNDGSLFGVFKSSKYQELHSIKIPRNAKTLCISWATSLGEQQIKIYREESLPIRTEIENIKEELDRTDKTKIYNDVEKNLSLMELPLNAMADKVVNVTTDNYNRVLISVNGDSILGSQLEAVSKSPQYYTGDFPPNMSKMTIARKFYDRYKFEGEDTVFRNLIHSAWVKNGFDISNGKDDPNQTFNEIEVYGANSGDYAEIEVSGYRYIKFVWSEYKNPSYRFVIWQSTDGGEYAYKHGVSKSEGIGVMQKYNIYKLNPSSTYKFKIEPTEGHSDVCFWGVELWNKPRLDVVVEAFSGSIAKHNRERYLEGYYSNWHKPWLVITDVLALNDYSYIKSADYTFEKWKEDNIYLYNHCLTNGCQVLAICTHNPINLSYPTVNMASGLPKMMGLPYIDILGKMKEENIQIGMSDGLHLNDSGISVYFNELTKIFDTYEGIYINE